MTILCVIGARGGSQGLPEKNIKTIQGKPLIVWSIDQALATPEIDTVVVSTDSARIAEVAENAGAKVPFLRPDSLSGPTIGKFQVWQHALASCEEIFKEQYDAYVDLDCTNPLRDVDDVSAAIAQFYAGRKRAVDAVFSVCDARKNPYFNLVEPDPSGALRMSKQMHNVVVARQSAPAVFEHVASIYVLNTAFIRSANHLLDGHAEGYDIGQEKSFDIDSEFDFQIIEWLLGRSLKHQSE